MGRKLKVDEQLVRLIFFARELNITTEEISEVTGYSVGYIKNWTSNGIPRDYDFVMQALRELCQKRLKELNIEMEKYKC